VALALALGGCVSSVQVGGQDVECVGLFDDGDPAYRYRTSVRNVVVGSIFLVTVFAPVLVVLDCGRCPVEKRR